MKQPVSVILLPTDKESNLVIEIVKFGLPDETRLHWDSISNSKHPYGGRYSPQHLYFLSIDEEIKEGDWFICIPETQAKPSIHQCVGNSEKYYDAKGGFGLFKHLCKKIVACTNPEMWFNGRIVNGIAFSEYLVTAKIPQSFITAYILAYNAGKPIKQAMLEYEKTGRVRYRNDESINPSLIELKLNPDGSVIWSLKEERMYTREEAEDIAYEAIKAFANREIRGSSHWFTGKHSFAPELSEWFDNHYPE